MQSFQSNGIMMLQVQVNIKMQWGITMYSGFLKKKLEQQEHNT